MVISELQGSEFRAEIGQAVPDPKKSPFFSRTAEAFSYGILNSPAKLTDFFIYFFSPHLEASLTSGQCWALIVVFDFSAVFYSAFTTKQETRDQLKQSVELHTHESATGVAEGVLSSQGRPWQRP